MCSQQLGKGEKLFLPKRSPVIGQTTTNVTTPFVSQFHSDFPFEKWRLRVS